MITNYGIIYYNIFVKTFVSYTLFTELVVAVDIFIMNYLERKLKLSKCLHKIKYFLVLCYYFDTCNLNLCVILGLVTRSHLMKVLYIRI